MNRFVAAAQDHYNDNLAYHNWDHAQAVMAELEALTSRMKRRGLRFPQQNALMVAAAWHDVRYGGEYLEHGFEDEEAYAAYLAQHYLEQQRVDTKNIEIVREAILGTKHGTIHRSLASRALHRADIANIGANYDVFLDANTRLRQEGEQLGHPIDTTTHKENTRSFVAFTISEARRELPDIGEHVGTSQSFDSRAEQNLERYLRET